MPIELYLVGAGGLGRELAAILQHPSLARHYSIVGFIDDGRTPGALINGIPVVGNIKWLTVQSSLNVLLTIGHPVTRRNLIDKLVQTNLLFPSIVHPEATLYNKATIRLGQGVFIGAGSILTTDIQIGDFSFIHVGCSIHHDTTIGENCVLMPGVRITGGATLRNDQRLEAGTCITEAITIG